LKEYHLLICCVEGQMTDGEICRELSVNQNQLNDLVDGLKARALIGRRKGILVASIEGRSAYYDVPPLAA
jgi:3-deoxy-D-manno-octulosonate 8-phosphate phosphatase KdsC-like HAD superfamily phosphatase